jgi:hypothetical protein
MEYRLWTFSPAVKWVLDREGVYWVNSEYIDEFLRLYRGSWK